jgi:hypothetical protein
LNDPRDRWRHTGEQPPLTQPIRSMPELIDAIRARRDELNLSHETIDSISGMPNGYTSKLLAPKPIRGFGYESFGAVLGALGLAVTVMPDAESTKRVQNRWVKRKRPQKLPSASIPASIDNEVPAELHVTPELQRLLNDPAYMKKLAIRGGNVRSYRLSARRRRQIAKAAARARWHGREQHACE